MKYYLIAGEASGDLHAAHLMQALKDHDPQAQFRFFGGDKMAAVGGEPVKHYRHLAYMGFVPVLLHLPTILQGMRLCKSDIRQWQPDCLILVDYPGFNLSVAKHIKATTSIPIYYYISPKIWAWKEHRIKAIKRDIDEMFSILPFEVAFYENKHHYPIHYVGNPTADEVKEYLAEHPKASNDTGTAKQSGTTTNSNTDKPIIALLAGSRLQEIADNLPAMLQAAAPYADRYQIAISQAPGIDSSYYGHVLRRLGSLPTSIDTDGSSDMVRLWGEADGGSYALLVKAHAALVSSGTATLETALFGVPQVVCYKPPVPKLIAFLRRHLLKVPYISLVNLIANREVVPELVADSFSVGNITRHLASILSNGEARSAQIVGYDHLRQTLGNMAAPQRAAAIMTNLLQHKQ